MMISIVLQYSYVQSLLGRGEPVLAVLTTQVMRADVCVQLTGEVSRWVSVWQQL